MTRVSNRSVKRSFSLKTKVLFLLVLVFVGFVMPRFMAFYIINAVKIGSPLYHEISKHKALIASLYSTQSEINTIRAEAFNLIDEVVPERKQAIIGDIDRLELSISSKIDELAKDSHGDLQKGIAELKQEFIVYNEAIDTKVKPLVAQQNEVAARLQLTREQGDRFKAIIAKLETLRKLAGADVHAEEAKSAVIIQERITLAMVVSLIVFLIVVMVMAALISSIRSSLRKGVLFAEAVSKGDLTETIPVTARDELGDLTQALNEMVENLSGLVRRVSSAATELHTVSDNLSQASAQVTNAVQTQHEEIDSAHEAMLTMDSSLCRVGSGVEVLSTAAEETASAIQEITSNINSVADTIELLSQVVGEVSASIVEMAASIRQVGGSVMTLVESSSITASSILEMDASIRQVQENATTTAAIAVDVQLDAETGRQAMEATMVGMTEIRRSSQITYEVIESLSSKTGDIGAILSVIDEVAEQTNLLALNAAIIAAQAGEHGKGFAVVADEIKELAERTSSSTKEIAEVIKAVQEDTVRAVDAITMAERVIKDGEFLSGRSGEALNKIVYGVGQASERMHQIAVATSEQSMGSKVIRQAMELVSSMIEQIATATREQTRGSDMIIQAVDKMKSLSGQVSRASREQSKAGNTIVAQTGRVIEIVATIRTGSVTQRQEGERIIQSMQALRATNVASVAANAIMGQAVGSISRQTNVLQQELALFTIASGDGQATESNSGRGEQR